MIYSYDVSREEKQILLECYERILENLAWYIKSLQNETVFEDFFVCVFLLYDGFLSSSHSFKPSNEFEYVFEFLVNKIFGTENVKNFYNTYSYYLPKKVSAPKLRPDTILKDNKNQFYYIIDAKYYNFGYSYNPKNLPESSSISKQIGYNHYLRDNKSDNFKVKSVFILPFASNNKNEIIKYVGYAQRDDNNNIDDRISICLVDLKTMINAYTMNKNYLLREKLIEILTEI